MSLTSCILDIAATVITSRREALCVAIEQGAKFERWLVIEVAHALKTAGFAEVRIEAQIPDGGRADIQFFFNDLRCLMEVKTCSRRRPHRPVDDKRLRSDLRRCVSKDIARMKRLPQDYLGLVLLVIFPVSVKERGEFLDKISSWKCGRAILEERPLSRFIEIYGHEGVLLLVLGPYWHGRFVKDL